MPQGTKKCDKEMGLHKITKEKRCDKPEAELKVTDCLLSNRTNELLILLEDVKNDFHIKSLYLVFSK